VNADLTEPPSTPLFDAVNRRPYIKRPRVSESASESSSGESSAILALSAINNIVGVLAGVGGSGNGHGGGKENHAPGPTSAPTPTMLPNTPTKLPRFLKWAKKTCGMPNIEQHLHVLASQGYGPDILDRVPDASLTALGISHGDALRLKQGAIEWWKNECSRRPSKRTASAAWPDSDDDFEEPRPRRSAFESPQGSPAPPKDNNGKDIRFEKHFINLETGEDTGCVNAFGSGITKGDIDPTLGWKWYYYSDQLGQVVPLPDGFMPVLHGEYAWVLDPDGVQPEDF
jgi:hypothetical protein